MCATKVCVRYLLHLAFLARAENVAYSGAIPSSQSSKCPVSGNTFGTISQPQIVENLGQGKLPDTVTLSGWNIC